MNVSRKNVVLTFLVIGVVGFIYFQNQKTNYRIFKQRLTASNEFVKSIEVQSGSSYVFTIWGTDEEMDIQQWATLDLNYQLEDSKGNILKQEQITGSGSNDEGGVKRAINGTDYTYHSTNSEILRLRGQLVRGDYMDIEIYENLPENLHLLPALFAIVMAVSFFVYIKMRISHNDA